MRSFVKSHNPRKRSLRGLRTRDKATFKDNTAICVLTKLYIRTAISYLCDTSPIFPKDQFWDSSKSHENSVRLLGEGVPLSAFDFGYLFQLQNKCYPNHYSVNVTVSIRTTVHTIKAKLQ